ncbi:MAG: hypothetical protein AAB114_05575, partial [Chloroflexota bacterium]
MIASGNERRVELWAGLREDLAARVEVAVRVLLEEELAGLAVERVDAALVAKPDRALAERASADRTCRSGQIETSGSGRQMPPVSCRTASSSFQLEQPLMSADELAVLDEDPAHRAAHRRTHLVEELH